MNYKFNREILLKARELCDEMKKQQAGNLEIAVAISESKGRIYRVERGIYELLEEISYPSFSQYVSYEKDKSENRKIKLPSMECASPPKQKMVLTDMERMNKSKMEAVHEYILASIERYSEAVDPRQKTLAEAKFIAHTNTFIIFKENPDNKRFMSELLEELAGRLSIWKQRQKALKRDAIEKRTEYIKRYEEILGGSSDFAAQNSIIEEKVDPKIAMMGFDLLNRVNFDMGAQLDRVSNGKTANFDKQRHEEEAKEIATECFKRKTNQDNLANPLSAFRDCEHKQVTSERTHFAFKCLRCAKEIYGSYCSCKGCGKYFCLNCKYKHKKCGEGAIMAECKQNSFACCCCWTVFSCYAGYRCCRTCKRVLCKGCSRNIPSK